MDGWFSSVGEIVQRSTRRFFGATTAGGSSSDSGSARPFADMHWHRCDVTHPLRGSYDGIGAAGVALDPTGVALVVASYLFTVHAGVSSQDDETAVAVPFWRALLAANPSAWFVFVEGSVSKKTWGAMAEVFAAAGRVLTIPVDVKGELPQRTVIASKSRPHPIRERARNYCYWFSPPPAAATKF